MYGVVVPGPEAEMAANADTDEVEDFDVFADGLQNQLPVYARPSRYL